MSLSLVTGYAGTPHVTSSQQGAYNAATFSKGKHVLNIGNAFAYELISNNLIKIKDGYAINQGRFLGMENGDYEEVSIDNGLSGVKRSDLIVMRYEKSVDTGIEIATMMVIKGTSGNAYTDPKYYTGNLLKGATVDDMPLYRVKINGLSVESVEPLFETKGNMEELFAAMNTQFDALNSNLPVVLTNGSIDFAKYKNIVITFFDRTINSSAFSASIDPNTSRYHTISENFFANGGVYCFTCKLKMENKTITVQDAYYYNSANNTTKEVTNLPTIHKIVGYK